MIDQQLYWSIPGPQSFIDNVRVNVKDGRCTIINTPTAKKDLALQGVKRSFSDFQSDCFIFLDIDTGIDVSRTIGYHFNKKLLLPESLATLRSDKDIVILLNPESESGRKSSLEYINDFQKSIEKNIGTGNVALILLLHTESFSKTKIKGLVNFDGGLTFDEMSAYATLHTLNRSGPGSTSLVRELMIAYSGYDVNFFHELTSLKDNDILYIEAFSESKLAEQTENWRNDSWVSGTRSLSCDSNHFLREYYLLKHGDVNSKKIARTKLDRLAWEVCLKVIIPWLEARRPMTIEILRDRLLELESSDSNSNQVKIKVRDKFINSAVEDIEYNSIAGLYSFQNLQVKSSKEKSAINFCLLAKKIRDDIAHLRTPSISKVVETISLGDSLFPKKIFF